MANSKVPRGQPIIWALDPYDRDPERNHDLLKALELWRQTWPAPIEPVSVVSQADFAWPPEGPPQDERQMVELAEEALKPFLRRLGVPSALPPRILRQRGSSQREAARALADFARHRKAQLIAVSTHGRSGWRRFRMGTFSEALTGLSTVPVLSINARAKVPRRFSSLLFPTDFSPSSRQLFRRTLEWAARLGAEVVLFHVADELVPLRMMTGWGMGVDPTLYEQARRDLENRKHRKGRAWAALAARLGVPCHFLLEKDIRPRGDSVLRAARSVKADLIVLESRRSLVSQALLGSVPRTVLSGADVPVLVVHRRGRPRTSLIPERRKESARPSARH